MTLAALGLLAQLAAPAVPVKVQDSVAILYSQEANGGMKMLCTATRTEREGKPYFITAAHCITTQDPDSTSPLKRVVTEDPLFLSRDDRDTKAYVRATLAEVGRQEKGFDYALLAAPLELPIIEMGDERTEPDNVQVINVAAPAGVGLVSFFGTVALKYIDRPLVVDDINWRGGILVDLVIEGGSSGSSVVSRDTGKIIGLMVGHWGNLSIAVPISRAKSPDKEFILFPREKK